MGTAELVAAISLASREQSIGLQQVNDAVAEMGGTTRDNVATARETTKAVGRLDCVVRTMTERVDRFRLDEPAAAPSRELVAVRRSA